MTDLHNIQNFPSSTTPGCDRHSTTRLQPGTLSSQIEQYLLTRRGWVSSGELCEAFGLKDDRAFRAVGSRPGLCSRFAISGDKGFRHVEYATTIEWLHFKHRLRRHGVGELVRVRDLDRRRHSTTRPLRKVTLEKDSPQILMELPV